MLHCQPHGSPYPVLSLRILPEQRESRPCKPCFSPEQRYSKLNIYNVLSWPAHSCQLECCEGQVRNCGHIGQLGHMKGHIFLNLLFGVMADTFLLKNRTILNKSLTAHIAQNSKTILDIYSIFSFSSMDRKKK